MKSVPITYEFNGKLSDLLGYAELSPDALRKIKAIIKAGMLPEFAIAFKGTPDENGVYHDAELVEISMIVRKPLHERR